MRKTRVCIQLGCCLVAIATLAQAQSKQLPGLWEATSTMSFNGQSMPQAPQLPPNVQLPPGVQMPQGGGPMGGPRVTQVCVTQAMIDKYGGPYSNPPRGDCHVTNVAMSPTGMTGNVACSGQVTATGTVETTWTEPNATLTKMHMTGTMQMGPNSRPIDMAMQVRSVYKGPDCGSVKPMVMPDSK